MSILKREALWHCLFKVHLCLVLTLQKTQYLPKPFYERLVCSDRKSGLVQHGLKLSTGMVVFTLLRVSIYSAFVEGLNIAYLVGDRSSTTDYFNNGSLGESVSVISIGSNNTYQLWRTVYITQNAFDLYILDASIAVQPAVSALVRNLAVCMLSVDQYLEDPNCYVQHRAGLREPTRRPNCRQDTIKMKRNLMSREWTALLTLTVLKWPLVNIFYDDNTASEVSSISDKLSDLSVNMHMFKVGDNETELYVQLSTSYSLGLVSYYLVFCTQHCQSDVLRMARRFDGTEGRHSALYMFSRWLLVETNEATNDVIDLASNLYNVAVITTGMSLMTLMFTQRGRELAMVHQFDSEDIPLNINIFPNTEFGFNLQKFEMTTLPWNPFIIRTRQSDGQNSSYIGYTIDLLIELSRVLNFTYNVREPEDGEWGRVVNGSWTGMIQMLIRNEVDIALAPLNPTSERQAVVDFTYPMSNDFITVLLTKNDSRTEKWKTYLQPFSRPVYGLLGLSGVLATIILTILEIYSPRGLGSRRVPSKSLQDMSWHMFGSLFAQSGYAPPSSLPGKVMMSFWWLFTFIMASVYCGNLTAFLTISREHPPLDGLEDMVSNSDYTYGYVGGSSYDSFFESTTIPLYRKMGKRVKEFAQTDPSHLSKDLDVHLRKVKAGSYAFISSRILFGLWMVDNCDLAVMKETIIPTYTSIALPKHSELTKIFSDAILSFYDTGLMDLWKNKWWPSQSKCDAKQRKGVPISLVDIQSAFYIIGTGIALALVSLIFERSYVCLKDKRPL